MMTIWLLRYNAYRDGWNGYYWEEEADVEGGYFLTEEAAQAEADRMNNYQGKWEKYVQEATAHNVKALADFAQKQDDHERAKAAGLAHLALAPVRANTHPVKDFDEWKANLREDSFYDIVEVVQHG